MPFLPSAIVIIIPPKVVTSPPDLGAEGSPTWGRASRALSPHAVHSMALFLLSAQPSTRGLTMAAWRSKAMTTVMKAEAYMAANLRNMSPRHATSPPYHCTVTFQAASNGITTSVTSRSAAARLAIRMRMRGGRRCGARAADQSTAPLQHTEERKRRQVTATRTLAAVEKVGSRTGSSMAQLRFPAVPVTFMLAVAATTGLGAWGPAWLCPRSRMR